MSQQAGAVPTWSGTLQGAFGDLVNAGTSVIRARADESARKNNSGVTPSMQRLQPWLIFGGVGLLVVVVLLAFKRR